MNHTFALRSTTASRPRRRGLARLAAATVIALGAILGLPGTASAHVTIQPGETEGGGFSVVAFRVPNERDDASTTRVRVLLPEDRPLGSVSTTPVPGWRSTTKTRTLDEPIEMFGGKVSEVVSEVSWTATGRGLAPGQFQDFALSLGPLPESGQMVFTTLQTYSDGEDVAWNEVATDGASEPEHPAPVLTLVPAGGEDTAGTAGDTGSNQPAAETTSGDQQPVAASADEDGTQEAVALALSGVAVVLAGAALLVTWRRGRA